MTKTNNVTTAEPAVWKVRPENLPEHSQFRQGVDAPKPAEAPAPAAEGDGTEEEIPGGWGFCSDLYD